MRRASRNRSLTLQALEVRQLLAGNVVTSVTGGTLKITGDNSANELTVEQTSAGLQVQALNGTRLNGILNGVLTVSNPTQMNIDLLGGNDRLSMADFLGGGVSVKLGNGNDQLNLLGITNDGAMVIDLGSGNDGLAANLGGPVSADPNVCGGNFTLLAGAGNDRLIIQSLNALANLTIDAGAGQDVVFLGSGSTNGITTIALGAGDDIMAIQDRTSRGLFSLNAGAGDDLLGLRNGDYKESAVFDLGAGNDAILSQLNTFEVNVTRLGGVGPRNAIDTLFSESDSIFGDNTVTGFESLPNTEAAVSTLYTRLVNAFA